MSLKIGIVSPLAPQKSLPESYVPAGSSLFWFNEIEACFAFLLSDVLDRLFIDKSVFSLLDACTKKYQKLIEQLHPNLEISTAEFFASSSNFSTQPLYFPKLSTLFKNGELKSVYQPIIEWSSTGHFIHGIECLSRVYFNGQYYAPDFIFNYAAEKLKITNYDKICLMQALSFVPHDKNMLIFINVRPQTLISADFASWFKALLKQNQLIPEQIVIEVTEQYCNIAEREMQAQCKNLKEQGLTLAIDDFGSGISNLSMLEVMGPSYLKISGRFIKNSHQDINKQKIIKNVMELTRDFGIKSIVESVEFKSEWQFAKTLGAKFAQGFYFFKPMAKEELSHLFKSSLPHF
jgi:EAL domain-containing protein (putative c-di-GMP-specific phosphodiesterase class I)